MYRSLSFRKLILNGNRPEDPICKPEEEVTQKTRNGAKALVLSVLPVGLFQRSADGYFYTDFKFLASVWANGTNFVCKTASRPILGVRRAT
jgi:hypothetical protein